MIRECPFSETLKCCFTCIHTLCLYICHSSTCLSHTFCLSLHLSYAHASQSSCSDHESHEFTVQKSAHFHVGALLSARISQQRRSEYKETDCQERLKFWAHTSQERSLQHKMKAPLGRSFEHASLNTHTTGEVVGQWGQCDTFLKKSTGCSPQSRRCQWLNRLEVAHVLEKDNSESLSRNQSDKGRRMWRILIEDKAAW